MLHCFDESTIHKLKKKKREDADINQKLGDNFAITSSIYPNDLLRGL